MPTQPQLDITKNAEPLPEPPGLSEAVIPRLDTNRDLAVQRDEFLDYLLSEAADLVDAGVGAYTGAAGNNGSGVVADTGGLARTSKSVARKEDVAYDEYRPLAPVELEPTGLAAPDSMITRVHVDRDRRRIRVKGFRVAKTEAALPALTIILVGVVPVMMMNSVLNRYLNR